MEVVHAGLWAPAIAITIMMMTRTMKMIMIMTMTNIGYYMAAGGYEFYLRVLKVALTSERWELVRDTFSTRKLY